MLRRLRLPVGARLLDIGGGAHSTFPYLAAYLKNLRVTALDSAGTCGRQRGEKARATRARLCCEEQVDLVQADAALVKLEKPLPAEAYGVSPAAKRMKHTQQQSGR